MTISIKRFSIFAFIFLFMLSGCGEEMVYTPKPRGFPKVVYPTRSYQAFDENYCQFTFEYPKYAQVIQDTSFFEEAPLHPCWFDIVIPSFNGRVHCSYYPVGVVKQLDDLVGDAFQLAGKHNSKAEYIDELPIRKPNNVNGFVFDIEGPVASPFQFFLTDSTTHFFRASLYFNTQSRPDSLAPIYAFVKKDLMHLINTFEWKK